MADEVKDADARTSSSSGVEMSKEDTEDTAGKSAGNFPANFAADINSITESAVYNFLTFCILVFLSVSLFAKNTKCRYESLRLNRLNGIAKVLGVLASAGGASIITLYKGPTIYAPESPLAVHQGQFLSLFEDFNGKNMNLGGIFLFGHCLSWSGWILMHAFVLKKIPAQLTVSAFTCLFGIVQFGTIATFLEKDPKAWQLNSFEEAYCILYSGVVISGVAATIQIWTIRKGGPVLASIYLPLQTFLVAFSNIFQLLQGHVNHLLKLDGAKDRLQLFKADLVEECSFDSIIHDCHGSFILFHWLVLLLTTLIFC
ncbi:protein WALLS ARE THIN 1-like [Vicia villosa]|uniref:protein WALLS ARE THIN 1-like n=1 Tax=Vicia villosa TaxID=3911 RepID=UPI00273C4612|nr:protein WALLS ARE THIN 1-like [Vicia villosa]